MRKIKLLHIISRLDIGGMERQLLALVSNSNREKFEVDIVYFQGDGYLKSEFESLGCRVRKINAFGPWDISICPRLYFYIKRNRYDIIHTHSLKADLWGAIAGGLANMPMVVSTVHNEEQILKIPILKLLEGWVVNRLDDFIIAVSDGVKRFLVREAGFPIDKIRVVRYGIDPSDIEIDMKKNIRQELGIENDAPLIGCVGRLISQKGHKYIIEAARKVIENFPKVRFLIVGKGPLEKMLKRMSRDLKISSSIIFTGFREDVYSIIDKLDLLILPSLWEGFGLVLLEAMALGKPIVATNVGGIPEVVKDGEAGILIPPKDSDALANAIIKLLKDKQLAKRMGEAGRKRVEEYFQANRMAEEIKEIYEEDKSIRDNRIDGKERAEVFVN